MKTFPKIISSNVLAIVLAVLHLQASASQAIPTVATFEKLAQAPGEKPGQIVELLGYHRKGDRGGGRFVWRPGSEAEPNGGTVLAGGQEERGRWHRMADDVKVTYFGARGDGESDDTAAIQAAIDSVSSTASPGVVGEADRKVGGSVHFPPGKYRISDTLLVGPQTTLTGVGTSGFQRRGLVDRDQGSVIVARFEDPKKWMISTAVYYRDGEREGELVPYRRHISPGAYDSGALSRANGVRIRDLLLVGETNENGDPPYGGIRIQAGPNSVVQGVGVVGVDVAYMFNAGWGMAIRDSFSQTHLYGLLALYSVNGMHIDNCYFNGYRGTEREIDDTNMAPGPAPKHRGSQVHMPADYPYEKTGILTHYGHNITLTNVITEHWDIARFHIHGSISDTGSWLEGIREMGYVLVTVDLDLRTPTIHAGNIIEEGRFMRAGTNVAASIHQSGSFPISYGSRWQNDEKRITVNASDPDRAGWKHYPFVSYPNQRKGHIRVAGDEDEAVDNDSLADTTHHVDMSTALRRIADSDRRDWTIELKEGAACTLSEPVRLENKSLTLIRKGDGERPVVRFQAGNGGRADLLRFRHGGALKSIGVDFAVINPRGKLDPRNRGLISAEGGAMEMRFTDADISLVDRENAPDLGFSLLQDTGQSAIVRAALTNVVFDGGHTLFEKDEALDSSLSYSAVDTVLPGDAPTQR